MPKATPNPTAEGSPEHDDAITTFVAALQDHISAVSRLCEQYYRRNYRLYVRLLASGTAAAAGLIVYNLLRASPLVDVTFLRLWLALFLVLVASAAGLFVLALGPVESFLLALRQGRARLKETIRAASQFRQHSSLPREHKLTLDATIAQAESVAFESLRIVRRFEREGKYPSEKRVKSTFHRVD